MGIETRQSPRNDGDRPEQATRILHAVGRGEASAADELLPLVYGELRELARARMAREPAGHTLQATALVHEAWLRLLGPEPAPGTWDSRGHFFAAAAEAMRRILVDHARAKGRSKRGGGQRRVDLTEAAQLAAESDVDLLALDEALERLKTHDERKQRVVLLRYFAGLSIEETAAALDLSPATVKTDWSYARAWLHRELDPNSGENWKDHAP